MLRAWTDGDARARDALFTHLYDEIHRLALRLKRKESRGDTLQTTALVHELYLRLVDQRRARWEDRGQFFAVAARLLRRIVIDEARSRLAQKRGGDWQRVPDDALRQEADNTEHDDERWILLDRCLEELEGVDPEGTRLVELRYVCGMSIEEAAVVMGVSRASVVRRWRSVKAWLQLRMGQE